MASVSNTTSNYTDTTTGVMSSADSSSSSASGSSATDPLANESTFLTLLVSQLKNQNPLNPMDGTTFVTQLAQFSDLEQNLAMRQDLDSITQKYVGTTTTNGQDSSGTSDTGNSQASGTSKS
jgi:flagellar basal-body rod modification protein FlgD